MLAAIGAIVVVHREARTAFGIFIDEAGRLREHATGFATDRRLSRVAV